jgi:hypothetical protein
MTAAAGRRRRARPWTALGALLLGTGLGPAGAAAAAPVPAAAASLVPAAAEGEAPGPPLAHSPIPQAAATPAPELSLASSFAADQDEPRQAQAPRPARRFDVGFELKANFRHSDDTRFQYQAPYPPGSPATVGYQETVDPGSHGELSMLALLADYDPSPLWHAHLRFNGINLHYRNPTSDDRQYDLAELWVRCGRETATAVVPEQPGVYLKLGKFQRPERQQDRHLESYGLAGTAFDLFEDAGLEAGADLGRHLFVKAAVTQGNPLFVRDPNALAGDTPELLLEPYPSSNLHSGITILYDTHVEHLDFAHPEYAGYVGWRLGDPGGANGLQLMAWSRRRKLDSSADLPGSLLGGDLATLRPLGTPIVPLRGDGKQEAGGNLWIYHRSGLSLFAQYVDQLVAGLGRTGLEAEAAWKIELPLALAVGGRQLFSYLAPAARYSKLHNRFANVRPTPEPSLAWDWEKIDGGIRLGLWAEVDLTVEYSYNRIYLNPQVYRTENEALGTLRIRL